MRALNLTLTLYSIFIFIKEGGFRLATLSVFFLYVLITNCISHELEPSVADFEFNSNKFTITISVNLETLLEEIYNENDNKSLRKSNDTQYEFFRSLDSTELRKIFLDKWDIFLSNLVFLVDGEDLELNLSDVYIEAQIDNNLLRNSKIRMSTQLPLKSKYLNLGWSKNYGDLVLRQVGSEKNLYSEYLSNGGISSNIVVERLEEQSQWTSFLNFLFSGFHHILPAGLDHILFIVGLYLFSNKFKTLFTQISVFTLAHSVSLAFAVLGLIKVPPFIVEPIIAISIIYVGLENYLFPGKLYRRSLVIFIFGLLHGLGFANVLTTFAGSEEIFVLSLIAFNLGVELGQITIILICFMTFGFWFASKTWYRRVFVKPFSVAIIFTGSFWLVERLFIT